MKTNIATLITLFGLAASITSPARADDLQALAGRWVANVTDSEGRTFKQVLEIKKDKFTFSVIRAQDQVALYAQGDVKTEQLGPFKAAKFFNIQGGQSASELQAVDDERTVIYSMGYNEITVAANFDRERAEPPTATKYTKDTKAASEGSRTLVIDKIVMHTTPQTADWYLCFEATVGDATKRFNIPDKTWSKDEATIATELSIPNAKKDQTCKFVLKLDDVAGDECTEEMDNRSAGSFTVSDNGSQTFKPEDHWRYTIHWHMK